MGLISLLSDLLHMRRARFISGDPVAKGVTALQTPVPTVHCFQICLIFTGFCLGSAVTAIGIFFYLLQLE